MLEVIGLLVRLGDGFYLGDAGPHGHAAEDRQKGGQEGQARENGKDDTNGGDRTERPVGLKSGQQKAQQTRDHRGTGGHDRRNVPFHATRVACQRDSVWWSASRNRAV